MRGTGSDSGSGDHLLYLDTSVFIHPILHRGPKAEAAREVLSRVASGEEAAATCALSIDEIGWAVARDAGRDTALHAARLVLDLPHLRVLPVRDVDAQHAIELMRDLRRLAPRDALHAACALGASIRTIVSDDADFDQVPRLARRPLD